MSSMHAIRSAGLIVFRQDKKEEVLFLLLRSRAGFWGFPKGRLEKDEENTDAAIREVYEETGIHSFFIVSGFSSVSAYHIPSGAPKTLVLHAAKTADAKVTLSREHAGYVWANHMDAHTLLSFANTKRILKTCYDYIRSPHSVIERQEAVYRATQGIPKGKVRTYKSIARATGKSVHPRTVGIILNKNHNPEVPCHRVVSSDGSIGGYNKRVSEKIRKLKQEGVMVKRVNGVARIDLKRYGYPH